MALEGLGLWGVGTKLSVHAPLILSRETVKTLWESRISTLSFALSPSFLPIWAVACYSSVLAIVIVSEESCSFLQKKEKYYSNEITSFLTLFFFSGILFFCPFLLKLLIGEASDSDPRYVPDCSFLG